MKRRFLIYLMVVIFLTWNGITYFILVNRAASKPSQADQLERQLLNLQTNLKKQLNSNQALLKDLQSHKDELTNGGSNVKGGTTTKRAPPDIRLAGGGGIVIGDPGDPNKVTLPVLVIACNRVTIRRALDQLLRLRPSAERFPIHISQDCGHQPTADVISSYGKQVVHMRHPDLSNIELPWPQRKFQGYYKIARHYKWAINQMFKKYNYSAVIIVEDDLDISPDFFDYFSATFPILTSDPSLWCVSAWNDNGKANMVSNEPELLYRTDFFPGLGWMLERKLWQELEPKWPKTFWDDWMRHPDQRRERACIRPEVSRTSTFGKIGVSKGQFFEKHLKFIKLNDKSVPFTQKDLTYLKKEKYDESFAHTVYSSALLSVAEVLVNAHPEHKAVRVEYRDKGGFKIMAKQLGIMDDLKSGVPRAGYRGVVSFMRNGRRIYFAPPPTWKGYDTTWN